MGGMKMLVVDDHAIVRQGLMALLLGHGAATVVLEAGHVAEGLTVAAAHEDLDAVILDLRMPDADGMSAISAFAALRPALPVIILSASEDPADVRRALEEGALGYIPKSASPEAMVAAVRQVMAGEIAAPAALLQAALLQRDDPPTPLASATLAIAKLTARQREVLAALAQGLSNKEIAHRLGLSDKTVKVHVGAILAALGVSNRTRAAAAALAAGLSPAPVARDEAGW